MLCTWLVIILSLILLETCLPLRRHSYDGSEAFSPALIPHSFRCRSISSRKIAKISSMISSVGLSEMAGGGYCPGRLRSERKCWNIFRLISGDDAAGDEARYGY